MYRIIIFAILFYIVYRLLKNTFRSKSKISRKQNSEVIDEMVQDPQCGTYIPRRAAIRKTIEGKEYYFCGNECLEKFIIDRRKQ